MTLFRPIAFLAASGSLFVAPAMAQEIVAPVSATIDEGGPGFGSISDTFNQAGLFSTYTPGVTNFDSYIAGNPQHSFVFSGNEWFSNQGTSSATVTFDMGSILTLDALALWNEDFAGIGELALFGSSDGSAFSSLGVFNPINTPDNLDYGPQVFNFSATSLRYARFGMSGCPQPPGSFDSCSIGEVAFRTASTVGAVPEPSTWAMLLLGFFGIGGTIRFAKRKQKLKVSYA